MKTFDIFTCQCVISLAVNICIAASSLTFGSGWQIANAFQVNPIRIRDVPYNYKEYQERQDSLCSRISNCRVEAGKMIDIARSRTFFFLSAGDGDEETSSSSVTSSAQINFPLVVRNLANQALIGYQIWNGGDGYSILIKEAHFGSSALILGTVGAIPMLALSRAIETSESPFVSGLNLSTNMAVLRLFGPASRPVSAFLISLLMATTTGIVEETLFRGQCKSNF